MEEEKAAAYYDELSRKGEGAAKFKQGLGFSSTTSNDSVPSRGSALVSSSSFLSSFVRASSPSNTVDFEKQAQLQSIQNKLKSKPKGDWNYDNSLVSKGKDSRSRSSSRERHSRRRIQSRSPSRNTKHRRGGSSRETHSRRRSESRSPSRNSKSRSRSSSHERHSRRRSRIPKRRSRSRDKERHSRHRSRSRSPESYRPKHRDSSRKRDTHGDREKEKQGSRRLRSRSTRDQRSKIGKDGAAAVDYCKLIEGYEKMTPAERVKAKMKLQLSDTARKDETKGMGSGWERFDFDKDAPLDDEEIEAAEDDAALVSHIGKTFRFSAVETRREEQIRAAHDEAIFGAPSLLPVSTSTGMDEEAEDDSGKKDISEVGPGTSLISGQALAMQQGSWRDRARRS